MSGNRVKGYYRIYEVKAQIILCACARWSESAHFAYVRRHFKLLFSLIFSKNHLVPSDSYFLGKVSIVCHLLKKKKKRNGKKKNTKSFKNIRCFHILIVWFVQFSKLRDVFLAHLSMKCSWWAIVVSQCPSCVVRCVSFVVRHAASTLALKAYSFYTPGPIDSILGRKHWGDLWNKNS